MCCISGRLCVCIGYCQNVPRDPKLFRDLLILTHYGRFEHALRFPNNFWKNISARDAFPCLWCRWFCRYFVSSNLPHYFLWFANTIGNVQPLRFVDLSNRAVAHTSSGHRSCRYISRVWSVTSLHSWQINSLINQLKQDFVK